MKIKLLFKRAALASYVVVLIALLLIGIWIADSKTRSVGFGDALPVASVELSDESVYIRAFDNELNINTGDSKMFDFVKQAYKKSAPIGHKTFEALRIIIRKIADQFLQVFGQ